MGIATSLMYRCGCQPDHETPDRDRFYGVIYPKEYDKQGAYGSFDSEMADEKTFLERAFKTFVRLALKGVPCQRVLAESGEFISGMYTINSALTRLTFTSDPYSSRYDNTDGDAGVDIQEIGSIQVASEDEDEMWSHSIPANKFLYPPIAIIQKQIRPAAHTASTAEDSELEEESRKSFVKSSSVVEGALTNRGSMKDNTLILVVGNRTEADKFATCMRILRYYTNPNLDPQAAT